MLFLVTRLFHILKAKFAAISHIGKMMIVVFNLNSQYSQY